MSPTAAESVIDLALDRGVIPKQAEGSAATLALAFLGKQPPGVPGAPGLDFETWDSTPVPSVRRLIPTNKSN
jgi:hypothetical protein